MLLIVKSKLFTLENLYNIRFLEHDKSTESKCYDPTTQRSLTCFVRLKSLVSQTFKIYILMLMSLQLIYFYPVPFVPDPGS